MILKYSCKGCGIVKREVEVKPREDGQDLMVWFNSIRSVLSFDHSMQSPECQSKSLSDLMIPFQDNQPVGSEIRK